MLGCLVEKQLTTPQQYPLTANALVLACNQTTNREPVVTVDEGELAAILDGLKQQRLVRFVLPSHGRSVIRYRQVLDEVYGLDVSDLALLALLLLRGPQTSGELRARTGRMADFPTVESVQLQLERMAARPEALVRLLPRRPGQKEDRWQQLLAGPWSERVDQANGVEDRHERPWAEPGATQDDRPPVPDGEAATGEGLPGGSAPPDGSPRGTDLRHEVEGLRADVLALQDSVAELAGSLDALRRSLGE